MESTYLPDDASELFEGLPVGWFVAGGWAIDSYLGVQTRPHVDLDIAVLRRDQQSLYKYLREWDLRVVTAPGELTSWDGSEISADCHAIWCRPMTAGSWAFEMLLNDADESDWLFRRDHDVRMPLEQIGLVTTSGLPCLTPEIVLLFKAKQLREPDEADLMHCLPRLSPLTTVDGNETREQEGLFPFLEELIRLGD